ncbi:hypothetical protein JL721_4331 [Aureococcus anophagefferens]|nr:hypothetical protein JL721_4331 [Aureococcus anophagefferens]
MTTLGKKLVEKNSVNEGDFVTENVWEDVVTAPKEAKKPPEKPHARPGSSTKPAARKKPSVTEQLATARSERDAVRLERDMLARPRDRR